jgi:hypothetical protein
MRAVDVLAVAALVLIVIIKVTPHVTPMYDEASVYSMDFQIAAPVKVAGH